MQKLQHNKDNILSSLLRCVLNLKSQYLQHQCYRFRYTILASDSVKWPSEKKLGRKMGPERREHNGYSEQRQRMGKINTVCTLRAGNLHIVKKKGAGRGWNVGVGKQKSTKHFTFCLHMFRAEIKRKTSGQTRHKEKVTKVRLSSYPKGERLIIERND